MGAANGDSSCQRKMMYDNSAYVNGLNEANHGHESEDEAPEDNTKPPSMLICDPEFSPGTLAALSKLRKNRQFCDVLLQVRQLFNLLQSRTFASINQTNQ